MGNKSSKRNKSKVEFKDDVKYNKNTKPNPKPVIEYDTSDRYNIIPSNAKFKKIDLVKYGETFDEYKQIATSSPAVVLNGLHQFEKYDEIKAKNVVSEIQEIIYSFHLQNAYYEQRAYDKEKWYTFYGVRSKIIGEMSAYQFPLYGLLRFCVTYNQNELFEFILTQELIECDFWCRDYFKCNIFDIIPFASKLMKLSSLNVMASYMIPERINKEDFKFTINEAFGQHHGGFNTDREKEIYLNLCNGMIEEGMNNRAQRIVQTQQALMNNINGEFPKELIGIVIGYAFGMSYKQQS